MINQITEHLSYERGYLKGFHDGRKWGDDQDSIEQNNDILKRWNDFCSKNIPDDIPCNEQWEKMKACWSVYEQDCPLEFRGDWKKLSSSALSSTAHKILESEMSLEEAIELFHDISAWLKMIK